MSNGRATGKSYRILLRALADASEGQRVHVISLGNHAKHLVSMVEFYLPHRIKIDAQTRVVRFPNGGSLHLVNHSGEDEKNRGLIYKEYLDD